VPQAYDSDPDELGRSCMHLTNYSINKRSPGFVSSDSAAGDAGSKQSLSSLKRRLAGRLGDSAAAAWVEVDRLISKALLAAQPEMVEAPA